MVELLGRNHFCDAAADPFGHDRLLSLYNYEHRRFDDFEFVGEGDEEVALASELIDDGDVKLYASVNADVVNLAQGGEYRRNDESALSFVGRVASGDIGVTVELLREKREGRFCIGWKRWQNGGENEFAPQVLEIELIDSGL